MATSGWAGTAPKRIKPLVRSQLQGVEPFRLTTGELAGLANMLDPLHQARLQGLAFLKRALRFLPDCIWALVDMNGHESSWGYTSLQDCQWLREMLPKCNWPPQDASFEQWRQYARECPEWKKRVKQAGMAMVRFLFRNAKHRVWELQMEDQYAPHGLVSNVFLPKEVSLCMPHTRATISLRCVTMQRACSKEYHCQPRLMQHLRAVDTCLNWFCAAFPPLTEEQVAVLDKADRTFASQQKELGWKVNYQSCGS